MFLITKLSMTYRRMTRLITMSLVYNVCALLYSVLHALCIVSASIVHAFVVKVNELI